MSSSVRMWKVGFAVLAACALTLASVTPGLAQPGNKYPPGSDVRKCDDIAGDDSDVVVFEGARTLWPPNHKYQPVTITAEATEDPNDDVTIATVVSHNQEGLNGAGDPSAPDVIPPAAADAGKGKASVEHLIAAERSGRDMEGRTYTIEATATFNMGTKECTETFEVYVPHDMRDRGGGAWSTFPF